MTPPGTRRRPRLPLKFFVLLFALSIPIWLLGAVSRRPLSADLPVSSFVWVCPALAASILVYREHGTAGVAALWRRAFDHRRIRARTWYAPVVLLLPGIHALTYGVMRLTGLPLPTLRFPVLAALGAFLAYLVAAEFEELGWSGYALDPLQARWNALQASLVLGLVWAVFHLVPLLQHGRSAGWIAWWALSTVAFRVLITWIYNNTGRSVFAAALAHAMMNLSWIGPFQDYGPGGYPYHALRISALLMAITAAIVTVAWGATNARPTRQACRGERSQEACGVLGTRPGQRQGTAPAAPSGGVAICSCGTSGGPSRLRMSVFGTWIGRYHAVGSSAVTEDNLALDVRGSPGKQRSAWRSLKDC
jgi:membrane protease YdiL (CAAX protease family)